MQCKQHDVPEWNVRTCDVMEQKHKRRCSAPLSFRKAPWPNTSFLLVLCNKLWARFSDWCLSRVLARWSRWELPRLVEAYTWWIRNRWTSTHSPWVPEPLGQNGQQQWLWPLSSSTLHSKSDFHSNLSRVESFRIVVKHAWQHQSAKEQEYISASF